MEATKTHWKKLVNPDYLGSHSLEYGKDLVLTIREVKREIIKGTGGKKEDCTICYFTENVKPMILNRVNQKMISRIHKTPYIEEWIGKKIQLYSEMVDAFGETVEALRIRAQVPNAALPELYENTPSYDKVVEFLKGGGDIEKIKQKYTISKEMKEQLSKIKPDAK